MSKFVFAVLYSLLLLVSVWRSSCAAFTLDTGMTINIVSLVGYVLLSAAICSSAVTPS